MIQTISVSDSNAFQQTLVADTVFEHAKRYGNEWSQKRTVYESSGGASLLY